MPTTSFIQMCMQHFGHRNQDDPYGPICHDEGGDNEEEIPLTNAGTRDTDTPTDDVKQSTMLGGAAAAAADDDEDNSLEWEMGIRRSKQAADKNIEDITLSDIVLDPDGTITYYWLGIMTISVIYNIIVVILRLAFDEMRDPVIQDTVFYTLDTICDLAYIVDIVVHHAVSFYEDGCLVLDPSKIKERYQTSRKFKIDVISILPYGLLCSCISGFGSYFFTFPTGGFHILLVRFPRLLKYPAMAKFFDLTDSRTRSPNLIRAFKLTLNLWVVIHWIGCIYYVLSEYEGLGSNTWVYPSGEEYAMFSRKYIRVTYWSLMTLTTIGERPPPETDLEYVFTGFTFLIGVFVFAAVVGNVGDVISNMNASRTEFQSRMDQLKTFLQHRHVDEKLQNTVIKWAVYTWKRSFVDEPVLVTLLPERLRTEIAINIHLDTLKEVEIFKKCEEGFLRELVLKLRPQVYSPGDFICRIGEIGREMYIVNDGKVEILLPGPNNKPSVITRLTRGKYFGEISLLKMDEGQNRRTADVRSVGYAELLRLSRRDLMSALIEYPNAKRILEEIARERFASTKKEFECCTRRVSNVDDPSSELGENQRPKKLLRIIQSKSFQDLLTARTKEQNELFNILQEVKTSQKTKDKLEALYEENKNLQSELAKRDQEITTLRRKVKRRRNAQRIGQWDSSSVRNTISQNSSDINDSDSSDIGDVTDNDLTADSVGNDLPTASVTKTKKVLSVDSAYRSTDSPNECCDVHHTVIQHANGETEQTNKSESPGNNTATECSDMGHNTVLNGPEKGEVSEIVAACSPTITINNQPVCMNNETKSETTEKQASCVGCDCSAQQLSVSTSSQSGKSSVKGNSSPQSTESLHREHTDNTDHNCNNPDKCIRENSSRIHGNLLTRRQSEQMLVCELLRNGIGLNRDHDNDESTIHKMQALTDLLSVDDDLLSDNSFRSAENTSDEESDY